MTRRFAWMLGSTFFPVRELELRLCYQLGCLGGRPTLLLGLWIRMSWIKDTNRFGSLWSKTWNSRGSPRAGVVTRRSAWMLGSTFFAVRELELRPFHQLGCLGGRPTLLLGLWIRMSWTEDTNRFGSLWSRLGRVLAVRELEW